MPWISSNSLQREPYSLSVKSLLKLHVGFFMTSSSQNTQISFPLPRTGHAGLQERRPEVLRCTCCGAFRWCAQGLAMENMNWPEACEKCILYGECACACFSRCSCLFDYMKISWFQAPDLVQYGSWWRCVSNCVVWARHNSYQALQLCRRALELCCERSRTSEILALWLRLDRQPWEHYGLTFVWPPHISVVLTRIHYLVVRLIVSRVWGQVPGVCVVIYLDIRPMFQKPRII